MSLNDARERIRLRWRDYFRNTDLFVTPITPTTAPPHDERSFADQRVVVNGVERPVEEQWIWAGIANVTYQPAVSIPCGLAADGLPVGMQAVGPFMSDRTVLRFASLAEGVLGRPLATLHARW
jgi:amidase